MSSKREKLLESAQKHIRKGSWDKAVKDYQGVLEEEPGDVRTRLKVADLLVKIERFDDALAEYQNVAYHYAKDDIYDKAVAVYKQALRIAPEDPRLHRDLGEAYWRHGRLKDSLRAFHTAQKIFRDAGDISSQRDVLERMTTIDPEDVGLQVQLAERYEKDGMRVEALRIFRACASRLRDEGRVDEFVQVAERAVFLESSDVMLRKEVIQIYLDRDDNKHALKHLQYLFKENPQDEQVLDWLGLCFSRLGEREKSMLVYLELAKAQRRGGNETRALDTYRKILAIDPNHAEARAVLGQRQRQDSSPGVGDTGNISKPPQTKDVLSGVEFLDDDDDIEEDSNPTNEGAPGEDFLDFAADQLNDLDSEVLNRFDENPATALTQRTVARQDLPIIDLPEIEEIDEVDPTEDGKRSTTVDQLLTESEVFLKYRLFDRAEEVIGKAVSMAPDNLAVREKMHTLRSMMGDRMKAAFELFEMVRISANTPSRAVDYLRRAREFADEATVQRYAERYGIRLAAGGMDALSPDAIDEISEGIDEISESFESHAGESMIEFLPADDLETLSGESAVEDSGEIVYDLEDLDMEDDVVDVMDNAIAIGDAEELDLDVEDIKFDESELSLFDSEASEGSFSFDFTGDEADKMFEELFGDAPDIPVAVKPQKTDKRLSKVDTMIDANELSEAEEMLEDMNIESPGNPAILARQARIRDLRNVNVDNAFGAKSLSGKFAREYSEVMSTSIPDVHNTNLELGLTYIDMGLFEDALNEFEQAMDDPQARNDAIFYASVCDAGLLNYQSATKRLRQLLDDPTAPARIHQAAVDKLEELRVLQNS
ncbi:MAG: tetratricopeptide repeat protein [bacterium]